MNSKVSLCVLLIAVTACLGVKGPRVKLPNGEVQGVHLKSRDGRTYSAFMGIPYAKPPKKFKVAEPAEPWYQQGVLDATKFGSVCLQKNIFAPAEPPVGSEDCLFINVYHKVSNKLQAKLPVMIYIHGGAFMGGSGDYYTADYFMDEEVVLVTLNYRVGALGFLSTGNGEVEPNLGLKDQLLAMKWVQKNIRAFGGDPDQVTIFGESAGSASVHFHILSPLSKGLFHRAILQSATALNPWAFSKKPETFASALGITVGCSTDTSKELIDCLEQKSSIEITNATLSEWFMDPITPFGPSLDIIGKSKQMFLPDTPINILESGNFNKVPLIITATEDEGLLLHSYRVNTMQSLKKEINEDTERVLPITLMYKYEDYSATEQKSITEAVKKFYFGDKEIGGDTFQQLTNMYSDRFFLHGIEKALAIHAKHSTVYNGIIAYRAQESFLTLYMGGPKSIGVAHGDDLLIFFTGFHKFQSNTKDEMASKYFVSLWVNFAATGNPGLKWAQISWNPITDADIKSGTNWFNLDFPPTILENPFKERFQFWEDILKKNAKEEL